ncbi:MAG TPA: sulfatase-like hydrolase/transferase [Syntrophorhabdaceae bacterium]|nr:sulfatase-like hydrolase/transferase [Syntrophorhabdaceae bacterium]
MGNKYSLIGSGVRRCILCALLLIGSYVAPVHASDTGQVPLAGSVSGYKTKHIFIVVMDGVRYSETFGDPTHTLIPHLYNDLKPEGVLFTNFYNRGVTITRPGHSTLISGTWQAAPNGGSRVTRPTLFEYYRDEKGAPATKCWSIFGKGRYAFEPYSSHPAYGSRFAPQHVNGGGRDNPLSEDTPEGNVAVLNKVIEVMKKDQPDVVLINFGYTDHVAHVSPDIGNYYAAIKNCDEQMWRLWNAIQTDPHYRDSTTVFFTNDHGRHTYDFQNHGDHCDGCEHVMLLVIGPDIKKGVVIDKEALQIDVAPTAAELLGIETPLSTGKVLSESMIKYLKLNKKEARTEAAFKAIRVEKLADRDLIKAAADFVLAAVKPESIYANQEGELTLTGMIRAYRETKDQRYFEFVQRWIDSHNASGTVDEQITLARVIVALPAEARQFYLTLARVVADRAAEGQIEPSERNRALQLAVLLGHFSEITHKPLYYEAGLKILKAALTRSSSKHSTPRENALDFILLGQAAAVFKDDSTVMRTYILAQARTLLDMKEEGALWEDPILSVLNLCGVEAPKRRGALKEFVRAKPGEVRSVPSSVQTMTEQDLRALFPERPRAPFTNLQSQLIDLVAERGKQNIAFSLDMLRYAVNEAGAYADGSFAAQGGFLTSYRKLDWHYGGSAWPGR